jgi:HSP90 family molecular chaperone
VAHTLNVIVNIIYKVRKHKKRQFKQKVLDSLDELREDNPKEYWKLINSLKEEEKEGPENTIELDKWYTYFRSLNKIP